MREHEKFSGVRMRERNSADGLVCTRGRIKRAFRHIQQVDRPLVDRLYCGR